MWRSSDAHWGDGQVGGDPERESGIQSFASWPGYPTSSLAVWVMRNSLVPQRRIQVRYVTVTKMRGYSCTAEVPIVSVSAVVEDFPHGSICHIPTATTRRNRARARLESEPHDLGGLPLPRLRGISPGSDNSHVFPDYSQLFADRTDTAGRKVKHEHIGTRCATTNFADNRRLWSTRCAEHRDHRVALFSARRRPESSSCIGQGSLARL